MISSDYAANAEASPLVAVRSKTGAALIAATVLASGVASYDANVIKVAVLAAVGDADLGEASAVNDAASRIGGVIVIAVVPVLIGASGGRSFGRALAHGYQPAMVVMGGLCAAAALIAVLLVTDRRAAAPRIAPRPPEAGCASPVRAPATTS